MNTQKPTLITAEDVWLEGEALRQLDYATTLEGSRAVVGMPDLHPGAGIPVGAAMAFDEVVWPRLVGSDAGCGVCLVPAGRQRTNLDVLERRMERAFDEPVPGADAALAIRAVRFGVGSLVEDPELPERLGALAGRYPSVPPLVLPGEFEALVAEHASGLGTVGGSNHFAELGRVTTVMEDVAGLRRGAVVALAHSGSRGLGHALGRRWEGAERRGAERDAYLTELEATCRFARLNRLLLIWRLLSALGETRAARLGPVTDLTHNGVQRDVYGRWLHRKGAAPAEAGQLSVVLGTRGSPSWVVRGAGNEAGLWSVAHGAGRRMTRAEAVAKLSARYTRRSLRRTEAGGRVIGKDTGLLYEQHPDAFKAIEPVMQALEGADLARRVAAIEPFMTVKR